MLDILLMTFFGLGIPATLILVLMGWFTQNQNFRDRVVIPSLAGILVAELVLEGTLLSIGYI